MKQSKRIATNTLTSWLSIFANSLVLIFLSKFLIHRLGPEQFGLMRYVLTIQGSLMFLDLGLGGTLNRYVAQNYAVRNTKKLKAIFSFSFFLFWGLGVIAFLSMVVVGTLLPKLVVSGNDELYRSGFKLMILIGLSLTVRFWSFSPRGLLYGTQRYDIVNIIVTICAVLRAVVITVLFLATASPGLLTVGYGFLALAIVESLFLWIYAKKQWPPLRLGLKGINKSLATEMLGYSFYVMLMSITTILIVNIPTFFAGKWFGPTEIALISIPILILNQLQGFSGGFAFSLIPVAGKYGAMENRAALKQILLRGTKFCAMICVPLGVIIVIFGRPILEWFDKDFGWTWQLLAIMMLPILFRTTQRVAFSVLMGAGSLKWLALGQMAAVVMIVPLSWFLAVFQKWGLYGIAAGSAVPILLLSVFFQPAYACYQVGLNWREYMVKSYCRIFLAVIPSAVVALLLLKLLYPAGLLMIALEAGFCLLLFAICAWFFALTEDERKQIFGLFKSKVLKKTQADKD